MLQQDKQKETFKENECNQTGVFIFSWCVEKCLYKVFIECAGLLINISKSCPFALS